MAITAFGSGSVCRPGEYDRAGTSGGGLPVSGTSADSLPVGEWERAGWCCGDGGRPNGAPGPVVRPGEMLLEDGTIPGGGNTPMGVLCPPGDLRTGDG